jgi:hypothetical protein
MKYFFDMRLALPGAAMATVAALLAGCSSAPKAPPAPPVASAAPQAPQPAPQVFAPSGRASQADSARAYRTDAAQHIYVMNQARIFKGKLPPLLYAIGVLQVEVDGRGNVRSLNWMRAPKHAPEDVAEIERTVRAAAPFPVPARMGRVVYTDTWLWHKSGQFQLDTLTEGQL